ncbi:TolC family protein [Cupriavidus basilensis]
MAARVACGVELSGDTDPVPLVPPAEGSWCRQRASQRVGPASFNAARRPAPPRRRRHRCVPKKNQGPGRAGASPRGSSRKSCARQPATDPGALALYGGQGHGAADRRTQQSAGGLHLGRPAQEQPAGTGASPELGYTLTQSFPFPGKKSLAADIANTQAESIDAQRDALYLQLYAQLSTAYFQALAQKAQLDVLRLNLKRLEQVKQVARIRYANNAAGYVDYLNAQVAQSSAQNDTFGLERQYDNALKTINTLIGKNAEFPLELRPDASAVHLPPTPLPELEDMALREHPNIRASRFQVEAAEKGVRLARKAYLPDFQIIATFNGNNPPLGFQPASYGIEFDVIIPLFFFTKEKYGVNEAVANKVASDANEQSVRQRDAAGRGYRAQQPAPVGEPGRVPAPAPTAGSHDGLQDGLHQLRQQQCRLHRPAHRQLRAQECGTRCDTGRVRGPPGLLHARRRGGPGQILMAARP